MSKRNDIEILWAAMQAMVHEFHAPQDNLTPDQWARAEKLLASLDAAMNTCTTAPAPLPTWLVTLDVDNGDSDEHGRAQGHRVAREQCAADAEHARAKVTAWAAAEDIGDVFGVETEPTYPLVWGDGSAACVP